ncbi:MAG: restriction endonuclease [Chloroflexi bacterium]|nr:restriction endonuclease [Chloroflexota bacterium]
MKTNVLYFGDNLPILRNHEYFPDACVDLIYLDPPFNSKKDYNVLFKESGGVESEAQIKAFGDSWHWSKSAFEAYQEIVVKGLPKVAKLIASLHDAIGGNDVMAYLVMMTIRLIELHRVLKPTGSLYLHCDPTASHYLKLALDQVFGPRNFLNEVIWCYSERERTLLTWNKKHDVIFYYAKERNKHKTYFDRVLEPYSEVTKGKFKYLDEKGWYQIRGRNVAGSPIRRADGLGPEHEQQYPGLTYRQYLKEGVPPKDWWVIPIINKASAERLGYPTQKPLALLERIIKASSDDGDIVLDPFCGCGTTLVAAQKLNRKWIGIDITHLAINLMRNRLKDSFPGLKFEVIGEPVALPGAKALAPEDREQFQWWALGLSGARPVGEKKKGADKGIDGVISFIDESSGKANRVIVQVKSGHVGVNAVRELKTVASKEAIGVLITLEPPTEPMKVEALEAGYYHSPIYDKDYPKIQILTIEDLLDGKTVDMPPQQQTSVTFAKAPKIKSQEGKQLPMA